jgi:hypothetical protein
VWNVFLLAALSHESIYPGKLLMGHFSTFVIAYREVMAASSILTQGLVNAAANINNCYAAVKLWLLLERRLSQNPQSQDGHLPVSRAGPFVIWNELWPPFSVLVNAHETEVLKGQNTVRTFSELLAFLPKVLCLAATLERYIICHRGPFPIPEGVSFGFSVGDRGTRGHP